MPLDVARPAYLGPFVQTENDQQKSQVDKLALFKYSIPRSEYVKIQVAPSSPSFGQAQYSAAKLQAGIFLSTRFRLELGTPAIDIDSHKCPLLHSSHFTFFHFVLCYFTLQLHHTVPLSDLIFLV